MPGPEYVIWFKELNTESGLETGFPYSYKQQHIIHKISGTHRHIYVYICVYTHYIDHLKLLQYCANLNGMVLIYESPMASKESTTVPVKVLEEEYLAMDITSCHPTQISLE